LVSETHRHKITSMHYIRTYNFKYIMKSLLFGIASLVVAEARFFRGQGMLGASSDFQGNAHEQHAYKGTVYHHASATPATEASTIEHITVDIAQMFAEKLPGLFAEMRENMETQADTGVLFCGAEAAVNAAGVSSLAFKQSNELFVGHDYSDSPVALDGILGPIDEAASLGQCGDNKCQPDSLVAKLAGLIRARGYHVKHSDICTAMGQKNYDISKCSVQGTFSRRTFSCPRSVSPQWEQDELCSVVNEADCRNPNAATHCQWITDDGRDRPYTLGCVASYDYLVNQTCTENKENNIGFSQPVEGLCRTCHSKATGKTECPEDPSTCCPGTGGGLWEREIPDDNGQAFGQRPGGDAYIPANENICMKFYTNNPKMGLQTGDVSPNQVARVIQYGFSNGVGTDIRDSVAITGSTDGCAYLRGTVLAINGNKLELKFVLKQHRAAEEYWQSQIDDTKSIIKTVREKIINLQGLGGLFYPLENSGPFQCNAEFSAFEPNIDAGGPEDPKCDLAGTDYSSFQGTPHHKSMAQRSSCFCRSFAGSGDDFYLSTTLVDKAYCDANFKELLPSVYTFCLQHADLGETEEWKRALDELLFSRNDVPTNLDTWFHGASDEIKKNFEDSIAGQGRTCGRVASADPNNVKFSNKGGNCVPINGVQDIIYRLEFEFFNADAAVDRKGSGNTYADTMCVANPGGEQILSFRQLAYQWQRRNPNVAGALFEEDDVNNDNIQTKNHKAQFYDDDGNDNYQDFCSVDFTQLLGGGKAYVEGATMVADPLDFLVRVSGEASFNVEKTTIAKSRAEAEEQVLWSKIMQQLTESKKVGNLGTFMGSPYQSTYNNIVNSIGEKAAGHFMAILGHNGDETGFTPLCGKKVQMSEITSSNGISKCEEALELHVTNDGDVNVGSFAAFNAPNLRKTVLSSGTGKYDIKAMAFRGNAQYDGVNNLGADHVILFKSDKYSPTGSGDITVTMSANSIDAHTRCGLLCDEGYFDNATEYFSERAGVEDVVGARPPLCDIDNLSELGSRHCELDRRVYQVPSPREDYTKVQNDKFDGTLKFGFYTAQITRDTKFDCDKSPRTFFTRELPTAANYGTGQVLSLNEEFDTTDSFTDPTITMAEFYLGTDCATLEIGDLSKCPYLEHIYIHTQTDYVTTGPNTPAAASCASKVDFSNAKFGKKMRFVWTGDADATARARAADVPDKSFIFFGAGSEIRDANGVSVSTDGEYCACKNDTTALVRGDEVYLVAGDSVKTRFTKKCSFAEKLVLPDSIPRLGDSAILDLEIHESIVANETDQGGGYITGARPFQIFAGEKLLDGTTNTGGRIPDVDNFALFIDDQREARLRRRCPTLTFDRDEGTRRTMLLPRSLYAIGAEEGDQPTGYSTPNIVSQPYFSYGYGYVSYGKNLPETTDIFTILERSINPDRAYDGMTASRGARSCFTVTQKQLFEGNEGQKTCEERRDKEDCFANVNYWCASDGTPETQMGSCHEQGDQAAENGEVDYEWGLVLGGDVKMTCSDGRRMIYTKSAANLATHADCRGGTGTCAPPISYDFTFNGHTSTQYNYWIPLQPGQDRVMCHEDNGPYGPSAGVLPFTTQAKCWSGTFGDDVTITDDLDVASSCVALCNGNGMAIHNCAGQTGAYCVPPSC